MGADKRVVAYHIGRLKDKRVAVRLESISELADLGDTEALPVLEEIYHSDEDAGVRRAAREAGRAIFQKQHRAAE